MAKTSANQNGAQGKGVAVSGKTRDLFNGPTDQSTHGTAVGNVKGNVSVTGISGADLSTIIGQVTTPTQSQVDAATPSVFTPPAAAAPPAATTAGISDSAKKYLIFGVAGLAVIVGIFELIRKFKK